MKNTIEKSKKAVDGVVTVAGKGFKHYLKTCLLGLVLLITARMLTKPEILLDPIDYIKSLNIDALGIGVVLFLLIIISYQLARSLSNDKIKVEASTFTEALSKSKREIDAENEREHTELVIKRLENGAKLRAELKDLLIRLGASRACICEMHNGTNNLAGIPFLYLDMSYEETIPKVTSISDEFKNFNLSKYPFFNEHIKDLCWIGTIDELEKEDHLLASKVNMYDDSVYGAIMVLRGSDSLLGFLIVTFNEMNNDLPDETEIVTAMCNSAQLITNKLDKEVILKEIKSK